ncbi:MAG: rhomboid family intramembrane serine protease [Halolamina sp.]
MATCDECGEYENLPYQCRRCGQTFCSDHRLPENHDCPGLDEWDDPEGVFATSSADTNTTTGRVAGQSTGRTARSRARTAWRRYFKGNATYVFLGLMWITFAIQFAVSVLLSPMLMRDIFVLTPMHPEYVWTWITSIFAHGGFAHIAMNSIGLYFFGPAVERRLGSKRYAVLFLASGAVAGLAQIGVSIAMGQLIGGVVGASGALLAIMGVLTVLNPGLRVYLYFFIPMPLWVLTLGFAALSLLQGFGQVGGGGGIAHWAHLTGMAIGIAYGFHIKGETRAPEQLQFGGGRGGGGRGRF